MAKGYSFGALTDLLYPCHNSGALTGNLNDYHSDKYGVWYQNANAGASLALNYPVAQAGVLEVLPTNAGTIGACVQRYTLYASGRIYTRGTDGTVNGYTPWVMMVDASNMYNIIYPVGIGIWFSTGVNPNNAFPGTTWSQILNGRCIRMATSSGTNVNTVGNIGNSGGADTVSIGVANLPAHAHAMAHTHSIAHDHAAFNADSNGAHTHTTSGTAASNGAHTHTLSGTAASAGGHSHVQGTSWEDASSTLYGMTRLTPKGNRKTDWLDGATAEYPNTSSAGAHTHTISGSAASAGAHTHTTSGTAASAGAHVHNINIPAYAGNSGGVSTANTSNTGSGTALNVANAYVYQAYWIRTA